MNVLSLFDGMGCGRLALDRAGVAYDNYFASEVDKPAIEIALKNYPDTVQLGDVRNLKGFLLPKIDLLIGGSPCQGFSFAGKRLNFEDERSKLFFEYVRLLKECRPRYFLLENVKMKKELQDAISLILGTPPIYINSSSLSAQSRGRLYWTNIGPIAPVVDKGLFLKDVWVGGEDITDRFLSKKPGTLSYAKANGQVRTLNEKARCLLSSGQRISNSGATNVSIMGRYYKLSVETCEGLQTVPVGYTAGVSNAQRYKMLGNGWTVDVVAHILKSIKIN